MFDPYPKALETCQRCPRLAEHRTAVARRERMVRRAYDGLGYWGRPVPGFGDQTARILLLGLAPGAHGSNRTGRMFTGDASGAFLYPALYRAGLANQLEAEHLNDGLRLSDLWITAACRCVPPGNRPTPQELRSCGDWLEHDIQGLPQIKVVLALGAIAHDSYLELLKRRGHQIVKGYYKFAHAALHTFEGAALLLDSYHVSYQNTNTGKLTPDMFAAVLEQAKTLAAAL